MKKLLFPPIVPASLPAFDGTKVLRYYFKPSIANSISQIKHLQMTIVRFDTNRSVLNSVDYPFDIIFKALGDIKKDEEKGFWYVDIDSTLFPISDIPYKIQIRLGETDITGMTTAEIGAVLKNLNSMSEWSIVTNVMPITVPNFGVLSLSELTENKVFSTGYVFSGYYEPKDKDRKEAISSFRYNLYSYVNIDDRNTWKLLSTSGEKHVGMSSNTNLDFTFPFELKEESRYIVTMTIRTKNLYSETKIYRILSSTYPVLEMFNSITVIPNQNEGKMDLTVRSKQILMRPEGGANIVYIKDEPGHEEYPNIVGTHAIIKGSIANSDDILMTAKNGKWICQLKAMFPVVHNSLREIVEEPTVELIQKTTLSSDSEYFVKIKIGCYKINLVYPTSGNKNPEPEWQYRFVVRKEILTKRSGKEAIVLTQNKVIKQTGVINPKQEYYFYIKEDSGGLEVDVKKTYLSTHA